MNLCSSFILLSQKDLQTTTDPTSNNFQKLSSTFLQTTCFLNNFMINNKKTCAQLWPLLCFLAKSRCCSNCEMQCAPDQKVSEEMREVEWFRPSSIFRRTWHALMFSLPSSGRELGQMHNGPPAFSKQQCLLFPQEQMQPPQSFQLCWNKRFSNCLCFCPL